MSIPKEISKSNRNKEDPEKILDSIRAYIKNGFDSEKYPPPLIDRITTISSRKPRFKERTIRFNTVILDLDILEEKLKLAKISFRKSYDEIVISNHVRIGPSDLFIGVNIIVAYPGLNEMISESLIDSDKMKSYLSTLAQKRVAEVPENRKPDDNKLFGDNNST